MRNRKDQQDPYAPPPMHHDRSGPVVRIAIMAALLGAAAWGYMNLAGQGEQTAMVEESIQPQQQLADAGYTVAPETPSAETQATAPSPAPAAPAPRAPQRTAPVEPTPEPAPPAAPAQIPPVDTPPSG